MEAVSFAYLMSGSTPMGRAGHWLVNEVLTGPWWCMWIPRSLEVWVMFVYEKPLSLCVYDSCGYADSSISVFCASCFPSFTEPPPPSASLECEFGCCTAAEDEWSQRCTRAGRVCCPWDYHNKCGISRPAGWFVIKDKEETLSVNQTQMKHCGWNVWRLLSSGKQRLNTCTHFHSCLDEPTWRFSLVKD